MRMFALRRPVLRAQAQPINHPYLILSPCALQTIWPVRPVDWLGSTPSSQATPVPLKFSHSRKCVCLFPGHCLQSFCFSNICMVLIAIFSHNMEFQEGILLGCVHCFNHVANLMLISFPNGDKWGCRFLFLIRGSGENQWRKLRSTVGLSDGLSLVFRP